MNDRSKFLGGSDIAAVLGLSPWRSAYDVWLEKTGQAQRQDDPEKARLFARGKRLEPVVIDMLQEERGFNVVARGQRYAHAVNDWMRAEIDFEAKMPSGEVINGEVKTVSNFASGEWGDEGTDEIPIHYAAQVMYGLMVTGRSRALVAALFGADNLVTYWVRRDEEAIEAMYERAFTFWQQNVLGGVRPEPQTLEDINKLYRKNGGPAVEASPQIAEAVRLLAELKAAQKANEDAAERLEFQIKEFMRDAGSITVGGKPVVTWHEQETTRFSQKDFEAAHPALFEQFKRTTKSRVFRMKKGA